MRAAVIRKPTILKEVAGGKATLRRTKSKWTKLVIRPNSNAMRKPRWGYSD